MTALDIDWRARCNLARSILDQREPSWHTAYLAIKALKGASIEDLMRADGGVQMRQDGVA